MKNLWGFPDEVDEISARLVASGVVTMGLVSLLTESTWLVGAMMLGFVARVATGPTLSPLGRLVTEVIRPRLSISPRPTPGPPKRFAQLIGATFSTGAFFALLLGASNVATVLLSLLVIAASLEAFAGICLGCKMFAGLMRVGAIPDEVCEACNDLSKRPTPVV